MNQTQKIGRVCAVLTGVARELQRPGVLETLGKRAKKLVSDYGKKMHQLKLQLKSDLNHARKVKGGDAAVAAKMADCRELHAAACEDLRSKRTGSLEVSSSESESSQNSSASTSAAVGALVPTITRSDSVAAVALLHASGRAWSCSNCALLQEEALEARRAAEAAADAKRLAEEAQARMWAAKEAACSAAGEQVTALEAEHAAALAAAQEKHRKALVKERDLHKESQKEAASCRSQVILEEARRAQVCRGTWETVQARDSAGASLEKAQAELQRVLERETARQERQRQREEELRGQLQALGDEKRGLLEDHKSALRQLRDAHVAAMKEAQATWRQERAELARLQREEAAAADLKLRKEEHQVVAANARVACMQAMLREVEHELRGERVRRGRYEAQLGRQRGSADGSAGVAGGGAQRQEQRLDSTGGAANAAQVQGSMRSARGALPSAQAGGLNDPPGARTSRGRIAAAVPLRNGSRPALAAVPTTTGGRSCCSCSAKSRTWRST